MPGLHDVDVRDQLGDRVLDLHARVHLEEVEGLLLVDQELDRARAFVADGARGRDGGRAHPLAQVRRHAGSPAPPRSASGDGAAPSTRARTGGSRSRAQSPRIWISMWRGSRDELLDVDRVVAEARARLRARALDRRQQLAPRRAPGAGPCPPPPAVAFTMTGRPISRANATALRRRRASRSSRARSARPRPASARRDVTLSPIASIVSGLGPMKTRPASATRLRERRRSRTGSRSRGGSPSRRRRGAISIDARRRSGSSASPARGPHGYASSA